MMIAACDPDSAEARALTAELSAALAAITGDPGTSSFAPDDTRMARACFVLARDAHGVALGCAALRPLEGGTAEVKRMYARPGTRGVGAALLAHIEQAARGFGYHALALSTRRVNTRAVAFYARHGYLEIAPYGHYVGRAQSICLGKPLAAAEPGVFL